MSLGDRITRAGARAPLAWLERPWRLWQPMWRHAERLHGWFFHLSVLAVMHAISGGGYALIVRCCHARGVTVWDPAIGLDRAIPALGWTIVPYVTYYLYGPFSMLITPRTPAGREQLLALYQGIVWMSLVAFAVFLLLPAEVTLVRDLPRKLVEGPGPIPATFRWLHSVDRPWNAWPSLHAAISFLIALYAQRLLASPLARAAMWLAWSLLILSILTTKQHFAFDLVTGLALGWAAWRLSVRAAVEQANGQPFPAVRKPRAGF